MPPTSIDGTDITGATIDGTDVQEITVDGQTVFSAAVDILDSVVDNFEDAQADPAGVYETGQTLDDYYSGFDGASLVSVSGDHVRQTNTVFAGAQALEMNSGGASTGIVSHSGDGLNRYFQQGETLEARVYHNGTSTTLGRAAFIYFGVPSNDSPRTNGFRAEAKAGDDSTIRLGKFSGGSFSELDSVNIAPPNEQWTRWEIEWALNDTITFTVEEDDGTQVDSLSVTESDSNIDGDGIGLSENVGNTSESILIDEIEVI